VSPLKFPLDEDTDAHALLNGLRHRGWDVTSSRERNLLESSDEEQLLWAAEQGRVLYTYNASDFCRLHAQFLRQGRGHAGIIIGDQQTVSVGEEIRRLIRLGQTRSAAEIVGTLEFLSNWS
jgi:hypothetical protein